MEGETKPKPVQFYLMTVNIQVGKEGCDLVGTVKKISEILRNYSTYTKVLYRFKVTGETKVLAIYEVSNVIGLERTVSALTLIGHVDVACDPLVQYEKFAERLGVDKSLTAPSPRNLNVNQCLWADFTVEYPGKTIDDLQTTWMQEATAALSVRTKGVQLEVFKVCGSRKVHVFIDQTPDEWDKLTFELPVMTLNGDNVKIVTKGLQNLDNYVKTISD